jgi:hypothetical protein
MPKYQMTGTFDGTITEITDGGGTDPVPPDPNPPSGGYVLGDVPFAADSSWNRKIPDNARYENLAWPPPSSDGGYNYTIGNQAYTPAVYFSADDDPVVQMTHPDSWGRPAGTVSFRLKRGVTGAPGTDAEILIISDDVVHNAWQFDRTSDTTATASAYACDNVVTGSGWGQKSPFLGAGIMANGASMLAGLLVEEETKKGVIAHALQFVADKELCRYGVVGEAINSDGGGVGIVYESDLLAIPRNAQMPQGLNDFAALIFETLQEYGCYVSDVAVGCSKFRMQQNAYSDQLVQDTWPHMQKIIPMLKRVS